MAVRVDRAPIGQAGDSTAFETCRPAHFPSSMSGVLGVAGFDADSTSACISVARSAPPFAPIFRSIVLRTGKAVETRPSNPYALREGQLQRASPKKAKQVLGRYWIGKGKGGGGGKK